MGRRRLPWWLLAALGLAIVLLGLRFGHRYACRQRVISEVNRCGGMVTVEGTGIAWLDGINLDNHRWVGGLFTVVAVDVSAEAADEECLKSLSLVRDELQSIKYGGRAKRPVADWA